LSEVAQETAEPEAAVRGGRYENLAEQLIAEFIGTGLFVLIGAGSVVVFSHVTLLGSPAAAGAITIAFGLLAIALAHGLAMSVLISNTGHISGGHHNPAVTVGVWVAGKIESVRAILYIVAQLAGAALGAWLLSVAIPKSYWSASKLGATLVNTSLQDMSNGRAVLLEAILSFLLVYTVFATAVDDRGMFKALGGFPIGLAIGVDIMLGGFFTGASMNPARSFGPALVSGTWTDFWVYIVGPVTGGILAAAVYWLAFLRTRPEPSVDFEREGGELLITEANPEDEPPYEQPRTHHEHVEGTDQGEGPTEATT
jgi:MIP family channel proteins